MVGVRSQKNFIGAPGCARSWRGALSAKAPKLSVTLENFIKVLQKNLNGGIILKKFRSFFRQKVRQDCLLGTSGSKRPWKSTFSSRSTKYLRKMDTKQTVSSKKNNVGRKVSVHFFSKAYFLVLLPCL